MEGQCRVRQSSQLFFAGRKESALLVADATTIKMLLLWTKLMSLDLPLAFPDFDGQQVSHLERKIEVATRPLGHSLPTARAFRKELQIRNKRQEGPMREAVSRALSSGCTKGVSNSPQLITHCEIPYCWLWLWECNCLHTV